MLLYKPMYIISCWMDEDRHENVTVAIALPAGITKKEDTKVRVLDDQSSLRVDVRMPDMLANIDLLHSFWNRGGRNPYPSYHPKITGFHEFFEKMRNREEDAVFSTALIKLPILVQKKLVDVKRFGSTTGGSILYVDLEGVTKSEYKVSNGDDFVFLDDFSPPKKKKMV